MKSKTEQFIRKVHDVNGAKVITIHPQLVRKFSIDNLTFMEQVPTDEGILLKVRRLTS